MQKVINALVNVLFYIFKLVRVEVRKLRFVALGRQDPATGEYPERIQTQDLITDALEVFKPTRIFFVFNILAFVIFLLLPQGKDVVLLVIEDLSRYRLWSLFSLLIGVTTWSVLAEFGARYKIYISDNSGKSLTGPRVYFRKQLQSFYSMVYLLLPFLLVVLSVVIVTLRNIAPQDWTMAVGWPFAVLVVLLILTSAGLARFYLDRDFIDGFVASPGWKWLSRFLKLPEAEQQWLGKLYGIYNDYVYTVRKETVFTNNKDGLQDAYGDFTELLKQVPPEQFPDDYILQSEQAPADFRPPDHFNEEYAPDFSTTPYTYQVNPAGSYRWVYKNNPAFYQVLNRQVKVISISSFVFLLLISMNLFIPYDMIGAPGLVFLSFGCWQGAYTGLLYIDFRFRKRIYVSARWVLVVWFFVVSLINNDHPVRLNEVEKVADMRVSLPAHFSAWWRAHAQDTASMPYDSVTRILNNSVEPANSAATTIPATTKLTTIKPATINLMTANQAMTTSSGATGGSAATTAHDSVGRKAGGLNAVQKPEYTALFITAEGGALRTGAFTAMLLTALEDSLKSAFSRDIYAFSTVSGGSVGVSFFNAVNYARSLPDSAASRRPGYYRDITRKFFNRDQLSPVIAKMFYGDVLNYFWPTHIPLFDRAIALEKAWEHDYDGIFRKTSDNNVYSENFLAVARRGGTSMPAWFINTTEVESGLQCFVTNTRPVGFLFAEQRDLLYEKIRGGINYSTAVNFSTRFPLFSPSGALKQNDDRTYHYVDGGYVENTGAKTMLEVLQVLKDSLSKYRVKPIVIQLRFGPDGGFHSTGFLNELSSIVNGIYNIRAGYSDTYSRQLRAYTTDALQGEFIQVPLEVSSSDVPMSWVFSERSLDNLGKAVDSILNNKDNELNRKLSRIKFQ